MKHVEIEEIANGYTVSLFDSEGPAELDKTVFVKTFQEAIDRSLEWYKEQEKFEEEEA